MPIIGFVLGAGGLGLAILVIVFVIFFIIALFEAGNHVRLMVEHTPLHQFVAQQLASSLHMLGFCVAGALVLLWVANRFRFRAFLQSRTARMAPFVVLGIPVSMFVMALAGRWAATWLWVFALYLPTMVIYLLVLLYVVGFFVVGAISESFTMRIADIKRKYAAQRRREEEGKVQQDATEHVSRQNRLEVAEKSRQERKEAYAADMASRREQERLEQEQRFAVGEARRQARRKTLREGDDARKADE
ncbi:MAG: hypothetical protein ACYCYO_00145 [Bacilli bacterium]